MYISANEGLGDVFGAEHLPCYGSDPDDGLADSGST